MQFSVKLLKTLGLNDLKKELQLSDTDKTLLSFQKEPFVIFIFEIQYEDTKWM